MASFLWEGICGKVTSEQRAECYLGMSHSGDGGGVPRGKAARAKARRQEHLVASGRRKEAGDGRVGAREVAGVGGMARPMKLMASFFL